MEKVGKVLDLCKSPRWTRKRFETQDGKPIVQGMQLILVREARQVSSKRLAESAGLFDYALIPVTVERVNAREAVCVFEGDSKEPRQEFTIDSSCDCLHCLPLFVDIRKAEVDVQGAMSARYHSLVTAINDEFSNARIAVHKTLADKVENHGKEEI